MKIGVDAFNLAADRRGMGRVVRQTLSALRDLGAQTVLIVKGGEDAEMPGEESGSEVIRADSLREAKLDLVWYPWNGIRFKPHALSVVTIHDPFAFTYPHRNFIARFREQAPIRRAINNADVIFTVSEWTARELERLFGVTAARVQVVPNAPSPFWLPVPANDDRPYFFFLGGTDARKNAAMLFRAYDDAFSDGGPELVVGGSLNAGDEQAFAQMRAPRRRVHPTDFELRELYAGALGVAIPSLAEGYGLVAVEAMACGAPVIASNTAALPETCGNAAVLLSPLEQDEWREALVRVAQDAALRAEMRENGFHRVASMRERCARALLDVARARPLRSSAV